MQRLLERLEQLQPIVSTVRAQDIAENPEIVRNTYEFVASVFYSFESVRQNLRDPLLRRLREGKPVLGYVSGEYGYGKTSTMVWLWHQCEQQDFIAVPPFVFYHWDDLLLAATKWLSFRLKERYPDLARKAEQLYERYRSRAVEELVADVAKRQRVSREDARRIVEDLLARGRLSLLSAPQMADFLKEAAELAREGGFKGFIAFADEAQNFVDQPNPHERVEQLRMFVHAFRTLDSPTGLFWGLTSRVEGLLNEQAGDMVQRVQDYGVFLSLKGAYTREFPKKLWEHLYRTYAPEGKGLADDAALEALGQICERGDLSNGPRTVIAAFRCIARHWREKQKPYTAWQLVDDYENRHIVFEGQEQTITTLLRTLLNEPLVQGNPEFQKAIRLLCVFPEGLHRDTAERYGVWEAVDKLANTWGWLGSRIYEPQHNHFALTGLGRATDRMDMMTALLQRFRNRWWHDTDEKTKWRVAKEAFVRFVLPELFPKRSPGEQSKWSGHPKEGTEPDVVSMPVPSVILEGSFDGTMARFPQRRIAVAVSEDEEKLKRWRPQEKDLDLTVRFFLLKMPEGASGEVETTNGEPVLDFRLNVERHYDEYPSDLHIFRNIMSPYHCTAMVLLNLVMFVCAEMQRHDIPDSDRQALETHLLRPAVRHVVALLFPEQMRCLGVSIEKVAGQALVERAFEKKCAELYPDYKPLLTTRQSQNDLQRYKTLLTQGGLSLPEKQGRRAFTVTREELTRMLGVSGSQRDAAVNRLKDIGLLKTREVTTAEGQKVEVTLSEHPLEQKLREWVQQFGKEVTVTEGGRKSTVRKITLDELRTHARRWGAHAEEVGEAIALAQARGTLERVNGEVREAVPSLDPSVIKQGAEAIKGTLEKLQPLFPDDIARFVDQLNEIIRLTETDDEGAWDTARIQLSGLQGQLREFVRAKAQEIANEAERLEREGQKLLRAKPSDLDQPIRLSVRLAEWLERHRQGLQRERNRLSERLNKVLTQAQQIEREAKRIANESEWQKQVDLLAKVADCLSSERKNFEQLQGELQSWRAYWDGLQRWRTVSEEADNVFRNIPERYSELRQEANSWLEQVMDYFAEQRQEALKGAEQFEYSLRALREKLARLQSEEHEKFRRLIEEYERTLTVLNGARLSTPYDPQDPEGSYERLFGEVMSQLQGAIAHFEENLQQSRNRLQFLQFIRQQNVAELTEETEWLSGTLRQLRDEIRYETVKAFRDGDQKLKELCEALRRWKTRHGELRRRTEQLDKPQELDEEENAFLMLVRQAAQKGRGPAISLSILWEVFVTNGAFAPEQFWKLLERVYRKGWLDISITERK